MIIMKYKHDYASNLILSNISCFHTFIILYINKTRKLFRLKIINYRIFTILNLKLHAVKIIIIK